MRRRFQEKGPNFLLIGAAVIVLFGMIWLSCHKKSFVDAFSAPAGPPPAAAAAP